MEFPIEYNHKTSHFRLKKLLLFSLLLAGLVGLAGGLLIYRQTHQSPVPPNIQKAVKFPVYYPDPKKLPVGYQLSLSSFSLPRPDVVVYTLNSDSGQKLNISVQSKPDDSVIQNFNSKAIPLRREYHTKFGLAQIGAYQNAQPQTIASLPTDDNVWIIVTAPANINQAELKQILSSLKK
ncbi:MAG TPA: hypothetical protein VLF88_03250 [Candidatus Babeliales bacterium]|nr:hypothetical protein [Candidatus Babeliales bacterium]